jgi:uncharacterized protein (TIGR00251 family)
MAESYPPWLKVVPSGITVQMRVKAGARETAIKEQTIKRLKIAVQAPPVEGKANRKLQQFLAGLCRVPKSQVLLRTGASAPDKSFLIQGLSPEKFMACLGSTCK